MRIPLANSRLVATVDRRDYERVLKFKDWKIAKSGHVYSYSAGRLLHQFIMGKAPVGKEWDHRDVEPLNNRRRNLRLATRSQNGANKHKYRSNNSGFKGVHRMPNGRYVTQITKSGKTYHLGCFDSPTEAAKAYDREARKLHGEFARTNF